jgi:glycosyltransferase involved in cell wall biosynthesis
MPLLSIVIPTRNRSIYLADSIKVILDNVNDVEVIVYDNSDTDSLRFTLNSYIKKK